MGLYEAIFIVRQDFTLENVDALADKLSSIISDRKGKILAKEYWGLRNLAYKINKSSRGHYLFLAFESENEGVEELRRVVGINEDIIRSNIFAVEEHSKEPSQLMVSINAKDYKPGDNRGENKKDVRSESRKALDAEISRIVINS